ncbi:hypothetical protein [Streptomyces sp. NPDC002521]
MDFAPDPVELSSFATEHARLSTSPEPGYVPVLTAQLRDAKGVDVLRGCVLRRIDAGGTGERTIDSAADWYDVLASVFRLNLAGVFRLNLNRRRRPRTGGAVAPCPHHAPGAGGRGGAVRGCPVGGPRAVRP